MAHPQIAIFARLAKENSKPTRLIAGQNTKLARTMHDIRYDEIHDELFVGNPFAGAVLVFRGGANGGLALHAAIIGRIASQRRAHCICHIACGFGYIRACH